MIAVTKEYLEEIIKDTCPQCKDAPATLKWRENTKEFIHETHNMGSHSFRLCLATHLRQKYKDVLNG